MLSKVALCAAVLCSTAMCYVRAYSVEPVNAQWSGKVRGDENHPVSEVVTVNFDLPVKAALFVGDSGDGGEYQASVLTCPDGYPIAHGNAADPGAYRWATCTLHVDYPDSFVKGRQVEVRWTRAGQDSIEFFWDEKGTHL